MTVGARGAVSESAVCDCGISWSYLLFCAVDVCLVSVTETALHASASCLFL